MEVQQSIHKGTRIPPCPLKNSALKSQGIQTAFFSEGLFFFQLSANFHRAIHILMAFGQVFSFQKSALQSSLHCSLILDSAQAKIFLPENKLDSVRYHTWALRSNKRPSVRFFESSGHHSGLFQGCSNTTCWHGTNLFPLLTFLCSYPAIKETSFPSLVDFQPSHGKGKVVSTRSLEDNEN